MEKQKGRLSEIKLRIRLDEENLPEMIEWEAESGGGLTNRECRAMFLSLWDGKESNAYRIDLWTREMRVDEMDRFIFQHLLTLADSYQKATGNEKGGRDFRDFAQAFAQKAGLVKQ